MSDISDGATTITPLLVTSWSTTREAKNVLHDIIGRADDDVTYRAAALREGTLECLCESLEAALALEALASQPKKLTLTDPDHPLINMTFVASGAIAVELEEDTREVAYCRIDFQQVAP